MKKQTNKTRALILAVVTSGMLGMSACKKQQNADVFDDVVTREKYDSVYDAIGKNVTIDMVEEDENGIAFVTVEGKKYELGMDFLSMAMVYNTAPMSAFTLVKRGNSSTEIPISAAKSSACKEAKEEKIASSLHTELSTFSLTVFFAATAFTYTFSSSETSLSTSAVKEPPLS